ncbi:NHLP leader peptide family natural product precursor [Desulfosporosinus fructosivorans]|uniref:NHLP leader peptide family natural product n=1 Tax=Desulfosporosinus fructosivorans TaxID=2018669 RepID=A0A4Z0QZ55_9FIRM|nr:NHLP leader peptide family RiPP precursor [Desulfosporosinus fructosivorans]TGE35734.1 NHLP leader peptide family natural product precursor [Desulfosporosinus fructosivorans]
MSKNKKTMTREELEKEIIKKAQADKDFKETLVANPKETSKTQLGLQVPEDVEVKVVEESAQVVYLVQPSNPEELTDEQLEVVSGAGEYNPPNCGTWYCRDRGGEITPPRCSPYYCSQYAYC